MLYCNTIKEINIHHGILRYHEIFVCHIFLPDKKNLVNIGNNKIAKFPLKFDKYLQIFTNTLTD